MRFVIVAGTPSSGKTSVMVHTLRHLLAANEILGLVLNSIHNLTFLTGLMAEMRAAIAEDRFGALEDEFLAGYTPVEEEVRLRNLEAYRRRQPRTEVR